MAKILIVDDSPTILAIFQRLFTRAGHEVSTAADGQSALAAARAKRPDLILLDFMLPDMSGVDVCRACKNDEQTKSARVLMLTGSLDADVEVAGKQAGAEAFFTKDAPPTQLLEAAARLLA